MAPGERPQTTGQHEAGAPSTSARPGAAGGGRPPPPASFFIDAVTSRHVSPAGPEPLLSGRRMTWSSAHGWAYDVWVDDPAAHALAGANSRFSLPAIAGRVRDLVADAAAPAHAAAEGLLQALERRAGGGGGGGGGESSSSRNSDVGGPSSGNGASRGK